MADVDVLRVLGNQYNAEILSRAEEPMSAQELSETLDVPIATCYRRIEELTDAELLSHTDRVLTDDRRRTSVYRRSVDGIRVNFEDRECSVTIEERSQVKNKLDDVWRTLSSG